jgi:L-ascorbate metabolism protein UlaG (beta-lactamase superfamily)
MDTDVLFLAVFICFCNAHDVRGSSSRSPAPSPIRGRQMKLTHLRNATALLTIGSQRLLIDPMLSDPGSFPGFKMFGGGRRANPLTPLPAGALDVMATATGVLITHEHPDHLDRPAIQWIKARSLPVWVSPIDAPSLRRKGLDVREVTDGSLGLGVEVIEGRHGHGLSAWVMGPVSGFYLAQQGEPGIYITGDTVLTPAVGEAIARLRPEVIVAPAGAANFGVGRDILFSVEELVQLVRLAPRWVVLNHLESLDHCPTTRAGLAERLSAEGLLDKVHIPADGESLTLPAPDLPLASPQGRAASKPGLQKWLTAKFSMT